MPDCLHLLMLGPGTMVMGGWFTLPKVSEMFRNTTLLSVVCTIAGGSGAIQHW